MATTKYIWDEDNYLAETDGADAVQAVYTNEPKAYGNLISQRRGLVSNYCHFDALGSTRQLTNAIGATSDTFLYTAWGELVSRAGTTLSVFTWLGELGYYFDAETAAFYVRRRSLTPTVGRWEAKDPVGFIDAPCLYRYSRNSPITRRDPTGMLSWVSQGPVNGKCGDYRWQVDFFVNDNDPKEKNGWIVQKVRTRRRGFLDCHDRTKFFQSHVCPGRDTDPRGELVYWERWKVDDGLITFQGVDIFQLKGADRNSWTWEINYTQGEVAFFPNTVALPGVWKKPVDAEHVKEALDIESSCSFSGWPMVDGKGGIKLQRGAYKIWDCCYCRCPSKMWMHASFSANPYPR